MVPRPTAAGPRSCRLVSLPARAWVCAHDQRGAEVGCCKSVSALLPCTLRLLPPVKHEGLGLGRFQDPRLLQPPLTSVQNSRTAPEAGAAQPRGNPEAPALRGCGGRDTGGLVPHVVGRRGRTWGPLGGRSAGSASGLCLRSRQWFPTPRGPGRRGCGGCAPCPRPGSPSSPGLHAAPAASRGLRPRLSSAPRARGGRGWEEPPGPLDRDAAAGCAAIGRGRWKPRRGARPACARRARCGRAPAARPRAGEGGVAAAGRGRSSGEAERKGRRRRGGECAARGGTRKEAADLRAGERPAGAHERRGLRFAPAHCAHLPGFFPGGRGTLRQVGFAV